MSWFVGESDELLDGVILFRGLPIADATDFSAFTESFKFPRHYQEIGLAGKRSVVAGNVKTANEEPPDVKFYYHTEYGRSANYPDILFFYSEIVPEQGLSSSYLGCSDGN